MTWRKAHSLETLRLQLNRAYPNRSKASDGFIGDAAHQATPSDHNPDANGIVHAGDFTHDPANGVDIDRLTDELAASRDPRIKYIIANGLILDSRPQYNPWRWVTYTGSNPHTKHFHLSVMPGIGDQGHDWNLPSFGTAAPAPAPGGGTELDDVQRRALLTARDQIRSRWLSFEAKAPNGEKDPNGPTLFEFIAWAHKHVIDLRKSTTAQNAGLKALAELVAGKFGLDTEDLLAKVDAAVARGIERSENVHVNIDVAGQADPTA